MLNTPRKVSNSSSCFTFLGAAVRWRGAGCLSPFVKGSQLRGGQSRLCGENCLAKLGTTSKITLTTVEERQACSFSPLCLLEALDSTLLPSFSLFLPHRPFPGCLCGSFHTATGEGK